MPVEYIGINSGCQRKIMKKLVLASSSPRRKEILEDLNIDFILDPPQDFHEISAQNHSPMELIKTNAIGKAKAVANRHSSALVIGIDTIAVLDDEILEKPENKEDAIRMIEILSGKYHEVLSAIALIDTDSQKEKIIVQVTKVKFSKLSPEEIQSYVDLGESMDKAAAYAIQGRASFFIEKIEGDYFNIVGFPIAAFYKVLKEFDLHLLNIVK